jgi:hypothetical protein
MSDDENDPWSENPFAPENADNADEEDFMPQNMSSYSHRVSKKTVSKKKPTWTEQVKEFFSEEPKIKKPSKKASKKNPSKKKVKKVSKKKASKKKTSVRKSSKKLSSYTKSKTSKDFYKHHPAQTK